jgi:S1-C subfamily serine protease
VALNVITPNTYTGNMGSALLGVYTTYCGGGAKIDEIIPCSPADKAGLAEGDVITKVNDKDINSAEDLKAAITSHSAGDNVTITYKHDGDTETADAKLGEKAQVENNTACIKARNSDGCHSCYTSHSSCNNCFTYER